MITNVHEAVSVLTNNQIMLIQDMLTSINTAIHLAQKTSGDVTLQDGSTMPKESWLVEATRRKVDYERGLEELKKVLRG